jgi:Cu/Ag efflux pump CusA
MKLSQFNSVEGSNEGAVLYLKHPVSGVDTDAWIKMAGPDSKLAKQRRAQVQRLLRGKRNVSDIDIDTLEKEAMETRVALTLDWGNIEDEGKLQFKEENVRKVYTEYPWVAEQVDEFQGDRSNFFTNSSE